MIVGKDVWDSAILEGMCESKIHDRCFYTFSNMPKNPYEMLKTTTEKMPDKQAFCDDLENVYSYHDFYLLVEKFANYLYYEKRVKKNDHIGLLLYNSIEFCVAFYAISKLGAVCVPFPTKYRESEVMALIQKADLELLIYHSDFESWITNNKLSMNMVNTLESDSGYEFTHCVSAVNEVVLEDNSLEDEVIIMFTSGTTSQSKGVVLRNYNVIHAVIAYQRLLNITERDKTIIPIPIYHITGLVALMNLFVYVGGTTYLYKKYDAKRILDCITRHKITFMHGSPTVFSKLLDYKNDYPNLDSLRMLGCGSSYTPIEKQKEFREWLPNTDFRVIYGMTETSSPALLHPTDTPTSLYNKAAGKPIPGIEVKITNEQNKETELNEVGEIWLRGTVVCEEYYHYDNGEITKDGWLNTGDMGYYNKDSYVFIVDRKKDMINRGGEKIWCIDVEEEINSIDEINECAVVGISDATYGEVAAAVIVFKEGHYISEKDILNILKKRLARFKIPEKILVVEEIYKTAGLKVDKKRIRALFE